MASSFILNQAQAIASMEWELNKFISSQAAIQGGEKYLSIGSIRVHFGLCKTIRYTQQPN